MITIDMETKSYADLKKVGAWRYSEDPSTDIICICWGIDDRPIQEWWPGHPKGDVPADLHAALNNNHTVEAHNVAFERSIWQNVLAFKYGWPLPKNDQWRDTMAIACYLALPAALDGLSRALGYGPKDPRGTRLISKYSKLHLKTATPEIPPEALAEFVEYCKDDVRREQAIGDELGNLPERELAIFLLSQRVNMRGIHLDQKGIAVATSVVDQRSESLTEEFFALTSLKPTQRDKVMAWCANAGIELENLQATYLEDLLAGELPDLPLLRELPQGRVRRALDIRLRINKASTKKLDAMARQCGRDGRARFQTRYHGAVTGRETGSGFHPLNLNRGFEDMDPEQLVQDIMHDDAAWLDLVYGDAMNAVAKAARYWITAQEGSRLVVGDYSSIEAVILACLAGEQWKIDAFRDGVKIYEHMADKIHGLPSGTVTKATHPAERHDGKTGELAFGYQGALGAWLKFDSSGRHSDERIIEICKAWRAEHPAIVAFWRDLESAAIQAVRNPHHQYCAGPIIFEMQDEWLTMLLPNDKRLWYREPQLRATMPQWHQPAEKEECAAGTCGCQPRAQVTYMAQKTGQWQRVHSYGGKWAENATQAMSREILEAAKLRLSARYDPPLIASGYLRPGESSLILSVYDEPIAEVPEDFSSVEEFKEIMLESPGEWADEWPINANVWSGVRYRK